MLRAIEGGDGYVPSREVMEFRELVRFRADLVRQRTRMKNRIHAHLLMHNISINANPFTKDFVEKVRTIEDVRVQSYLRLIDPLNHEIKEVSKTIQEKAANNPDANLLMTIPGISFYSALSLSARLER